MPVLKGSVSFSRFLVERTDKTLADERRMLSRGLKARAFEALDRKGDEDKSSGFVELEDADSTEFAVGNLYRGEHALFAFRIDQLRVPGGAVKTELTKWSSAYFRENGRKPTRSETAEQREVLRHAFRMRAFPSTRVFDISWNLQTQRLQIWATARGVIEEIERTLEEAFAVKVLPLVPSALAARAGVDDASLVPTPELVGGNVEGVHHADA